MAEPAPDPSAAAFRYATERARLPLTVGLAVAGATIALGYLSGLVQGPLVAVVGGIALMTFGRGLGCSRREAALLCASFVLLAGAWSVAAMRWSTLLLNDLSGAQGVLGQTLVVGSPGVVMGLWLAAGAGALALAVWAASPPVGGRAVWVRGIEALPVAFATTSVFWGPAVAGARIGDLAGWLLAIALLALIGTAGAAFLHATRARWVAMTIAASALLVGAGYVARGL